MDAITRYEKAKTHRLSLEYVWRECFDYTYPILGAGLQSTREATGALAEANAAKVQKLYDSTAAESCRMLASALLSGLTPANTRWFALDASPRKPGAAVMSNSRWLDETADAVWQAIHDGNYDSVGMETILSWVIAGWGAMFIELDEKDGSLRFEHWPLAEVYIAQSRPSGPADVVMRAFSLTAKQAVTQYGKDDLPDSIRQIAKIEPDKTFEFLWVIEPRAGGDYSAKLAKSMPISSCLYEISSKKMIRESGFREMPVVVPRWLPLPNSAYAIGPMYEAVADTKTLNKVVQFVLMNADLATAGMWIAEDDGVLNPRTIQIGPRKVVVANSVDSMKALTPASKFDVAFVTMENFEKKIRRMLMSDQLQLPANVQMTATEVTARLEQLRQLLAPILGRLQSEFLQPLIVRCFSLLLASGQIAPPPRAMGENLNIRYVSPLARAQRAADVNVMDRLELDMLNKVSIIQDPSLLDIYDFEEAEREKARLLGVPLKLLREQHVIKQIRKQRADAQAAQAQQVQREQDMEAAASTLLKRELAG